MAIFFARKRERFLGGFFFSARKREFFWGVFLGYFWGIFFCVLGVFVFDFRALARIFFGFFFSR